MNRSRAFRTSDERAAAWHGRPWRLALGSAASILALVTSAALIASADEPPARLIAADYATPSEELRVEFGGSAKALQLEVDRQPVSMAAAVVSPLRAEGSVVLAIEASSSTAGAMLAREQAAARALIETLPPEVAVGIVAFGDTARAVAPLGTDRAATLALLDALSPSSGSALYSGVDAAAAMLSEAVQPRSLVVLTYGWHFGSNAVSRAQSIESVRRAGATAHAFAFGIEFDAPYFSTLADGGGSFSTGPDAASVAALGPQLFSTLSVARIPLALSGGQHSVRLASDAHELEFTVEVPAPVASTTPAPPVATVAPIDEATAEPAQPAPASDPVERPATLGLEVWIGLLALAGLAAGAWLGRGRLASMARRRRELAPTAGPRLADGWKKPWIERLRAPRGLDVRYQPVFRAATGELVGAETLLRAVVPPHPSPGGNRILRQATARQLRKITRHVVDDACRVGASLTEEGASGFEVSVNVSIEQLLDPGFVRMLTAALAGSKLSPAQLSLEVREFNLIDNAEAVAVLRALAALGVKLIVDDFWASAPQLLAELRPSAVKVDFSHLEVSPQAEHELERIVRSARFAGITVIAKRIEAPSQRAFAESLGCQLLQGNQFSEALDRADLLSLARTRRELVSSTELASTTSREGDPPSPLHQAA